MLSKNIFERIYIKRRNLIHLSEDAAVCAVVGNRAERTNKPRK